MFWSAGCSLLRAGLSCSLGVLYGGLGISKLQFFYQENKCSGGGGSHRAGESEQGEAENEEGLPAGRPHPWRRPCCRSCCCRPCQESCPRWCSIFCLVFSLSVLRYRYLYCLVLLWKPLWPVFRIRICMDLKWSRFRKKIYTVYFKATKVPMGFKPFFLLEVSFTFLFKSKREQYKYTTF